MDAASHKIILERLNEEWIGVTDASVYRELELERQLWMLAALKALHAADALATDGQDAAPIGEGSRKILSLYENKGKSSNYHVPTRFLPSLQHRRRSCPLQIPPSKSITSLPRPSSQNTIPTCILSPFQDLPSNYPTHPTSLPTSTPSPSPPYFPRPPSPLS